MDIKRTWYGKTTLIFDEEDARRYPRTIKAFRYLEQARKLIIRGTAGAIVSYALYTGAGLFSIAYNNKAMELSPIIDDEQHLEQLLMEGQRRHGIESKTIHASFAPAIPTSGACRNDDGSYSIFLSSEQHKVSILEHELYHIADGHCDKRYDAVAYGSSIARIGHAFATRLYLEPKTAVHTLRFIKKEAATHK